jgi:hypothetical protein
MRASRQGDKSSRGPIMPNEELLQQLEQEGVIDPRVKADPEWQQIWEEMDPEDLQLLREVKQRFDELGVQQGLYPTGWKAFWGIIK